MKKKKTTVKKQSKTPLRRPVKKTKNSALVSDLQTGQDAPLFALLSDDGNTVSLSQYLGRRVVLYFYPKDDTRGCTQESCDFRDSWTRLNQLNVVVLGVSRDSVASHVKFKQKYGFPFPLLSDEDGKVCELYGVWKEKSLYGRKYMGIDRSTFVIDENGKIFQAYRNVKVNGHVDALIQILSTK